MLRYEYSWESKTLNMLENLPKDFSMALGMICKEHTLVAMRWGLAQAKLKAPNFDGDLARSLGIFNGNYARRGKYSGEWSGHIGFTSNDIIVDSSDVWIAPLPFNYGWIKHEGEQSESGHPHRVYLYNTRTGGTTKNRQKLVKYLKSKSSMWATLPDAPTKETWNKKPAKGFFPPPFVDVDPRQSATDYIDQLINDSAMKNHFLDIVSDGIIADIKLYWEGWRP